MVKHGLGISGPHHVKDLMGWQKLILDDISLSERENSQLDTGFVRYWVCKILDL